MESSKKKIKITPILFSYGENLASEFIAFCPPISRLKIFKSYPTEYIIIKEFDVVFEYDNILYGFINNEAFFVEENDQGFIKPGFQGGILLEQINLKEIVDCYGKKLFIVFKNFKNVYFLLTILQADSSVFIFGSATVENEYEYETMESWNRESMEYSFVVQDVKSISFDSLYTTSIYLTKNQEVFYVNETEYEKLAIKNVVEIGHHDYPNFYFKTNDGKVQMYDLDTDTIENADSFPKQNMCIVDTEAEKKGIFSLEKTVEFF